MTVATMTGKGQITVPKDIRDEMGLVPGSKVMFIKLGPNDIRMIGRTGKIEDLFGILHRPGQRSLSIEEINDGIAEGAAHAAMRGVSYQEDDE